MKDVVLRKPDENDIEALKNLWAEIFSSVGMDAFFECLYNRELCRAVFVGNQLAAMGFLVDTGELRSGGAALKAAMIYSVATAIEHRGNGYAKKVVEQLVSDAHDLGYLVVVLSPSNDGLFDFYREKNNFVDYFYIEEKIFEKAQIDALLQERDVKSDFSGSSASLEEISPEIYVKMRNDLLSEFVFLSQSVGILRYQNLICDEVGGGLYRFGSSCAVVEVQDCLSICVKELLYTDDDYLEILLAITEKFPAHKYVVRTPAMGESEAFRKLGMISTEKKDFAGSCHLKSFPWYGLALD